jgi:hypothetical protein
MTTGGGGTNAEDAAAMTPMSPWGHIQRCLDMSSSSSSLSLTQRQRQRKFVAKMMTSTAAVTSIVSPLSTLPPSTRDDVDGVPYNLWLDQTTARVLSLEDEDDNYDFVDDD